MADTSPDGAQILPDSALVQRLDRRRTEPVGVVNLRSFESQYARMPGWLVQRSALLDQLQSRHGGNGTATPEGADLVFAAPARPLSREQSPLGALPPLRTPTPLPVAASLPTGSFRVSRSAIAQSPTSIITPSSPSIDPPTVDASGSPSQAGAIATDPAIARSSRISIQRWTPGSATLPLQTKLDQTVSPAAAVQLGLPPLAVDLPIVKHSSAPIDVSRSTILSAETAESGIPAVPAGDTLKPTITQSSDRTPMILRQVDSEPTMAQNPPLVLESNQTPLAESVTIPSVSSPALAGSEIGNLPIQPALTNLSSGAAPDRVIVLRKVDDPTSDRPLARSPALTILPGQLNLVARAIVPSSPTGSVTPSSGLPVSPALPLIRWLATSAETPAQVQRQSENSVANPAVLDSAAGSLSADRPFAPQSAPSSAVMSAGRVTAPALPSTVSPLLQGIIWRKTRVDPPGGNGLAGSQRSQPQGLPLAISSSLGNGQALARQPDDLTLFRALDDSGGAIASPMSTSEPESSGGTSLNMAQIAQHVSRILARQLVVERERRGINPW